MKPRSVPPVATTRVRDGKSWRLGGAADVAWIAEHTRVGRTIESAIPPVFGAYATIDVPGDEAQRAEQDLALTALLTRQPSGGVWWLGYLDTGADDVVFADAPMVTLYSGWHYVFVAAGPEQAARWKDPGSWRGSLPDVIFPPDRSWLLTTLWDDEWRCLGGSAELIDAAHRDPRIRARPVRAGEDATPPGHGSR